jgi:hypothetical protein
VGRPAPGAEPGINGHRRAIRSFGINTDFQVRRPTLPGTPRQSGRGDPQRLPGEARPCSVLRPRLRPSGAACAEQALTGPARDAAGARRAPCDPCEQPATPRGRARLDSGRDPHLLPLSTRRRRRGAGPRRSPQSVGMGHTGRARRLSTGRAVVRQLGVPRAARRGAARGPRGDGRALRRGRWRRPLAGRSMRWRPPWTVACGRGASSQARARRRSRTRRGTSRTARGWRTLWSSRGRSPLPRRSGAPYGTTAPAFSLWQLARGTRWRLRAVCVPPGRRAISAVAAGAAGFPHVTRPARRRRAVLVGRRVHHGPGLR